MWRLTKAMAEMKQEHWKKRWNGSRCTKLALSASWTHGLIASERNTEYGILNGTGRRFKAHSGQLSAATFKNPSVVNTIHIYRKKFGILRSPFKTTHETRWIYIKDTGEFLEKLKRVEGIPKGAILVTAEVVGLYPTISHDGGLQILRKQYNKFKDKMVPTDDIIKMADFVVKNNLFEFDCKFYQQTSGTAIGTKFAPPYACIFMGFIETEFLKTQAIKPWLWKRFIDDIFFIRTDSKENLNKFLKDLNEFHPNLRFTYEKSKEKIINFLDLVIKLTEGKVVTDLYCKSTDSHQYLHYDSCYAEHIKRSIIFSQILRLKRICSQKSDLNFHVKEL